MNPTLAAALNISKDTPQLITLVDTLATGAAPLIYHFVDFYQSSSMVFVGLVETQDHYGSVCKKMVRMR